MTALDRILVPIDFSEPSRQALECGLELAGRVKAAVEVLHATTSPLYLDPQIAVQIAEGKSKLTVETLAKDDATARLKTFLEEAGASVPAHVEFDEPFDAIMKHAESADLMVIGTHGRKGMQRWLMGSMAEKLVRSCPCPVLTYREGKNKIPRRILVPVDFSNGCRRALAMASYFKNAYNAELDLLHVVQHIPALEGAELLVVRFEGEDSQPFETFARDRAQKEIAMFLKGTPGQEADVRVELGDPVPVILNAILEQEYDLVALGTHGRSGFRRFMLGSVAERVVRAASCSVLTVRELEPPPP